MRQYISYLVTTSRRILRLYPGYKVNLAVVAWYNVARVLDNGRVPRTREYWDERRTRLDAKSIEQQWVGSTRKTNPTRRTWTPAASRGPDFPSPGHQKGLIFPCRAAASGSLLILTVNRTFISIAPPSGPARSCYHDVAFKFG